MRPLGRYKSDLSKKVKETHMDTHIQIKLTSHTYRQVPNEILVEQSKSYII